MSLPVGVTERLTSNLSPTFASNNVNVTVDSNGYLFAVADKLSPDSKATITATQGNQVRTCDVTIVNWTANRLQLRPVDYLPDYVLSKNGSTLYGSTGVQLYSTTNGFATTTRLPNLPAASTPTPLLFTPHGTFLRTDTAIYKSIDGLQNWTLCINGLLPVLNHGFDWYYDGTNVYIYTGEYTNTTTDRHRLIRGTIALNGIETWTTLQTFFSQDDYTADPVNNVPSVEHIHSVIVDRSNGDLYILTGDEDWECYIFYSSDKGATIKALGTGSQAWRALSVWFTTDYIYFNTDSSLTQKIYRLARANLAAQAVGNDLREEVATLNNASHWYHCYATDDQGRNIVIMSTAAEGQIRDMKGRLFSFFENQNGTVEIQELFLVVGLDPAAYSPYIQLEPKFQDGDDVYFRASGAVRYNGLPTAGCWKMRFFRESAP